MRVTREMPFTDWLRRIRGPILKLEVRSAHPGSPGLWWVAAVPGAPRNLLRVLLGRKTGYRKHPRQ